MAQAIIADDIPDEFCVNDLNKFLAVNSLAKDTEIKFTDKQIYFTVNNRTTKITKGELRAIVVPPEKNIIIDKPDCIFKMSKDDFDSTIKLAGILSSPNISIESDGDDISIVTADIKESSSDKNYTKVAKGNGKKFNIIFRKENIKMISGSYEVIISFKGFVHFKNENGLIDYWVAFEAKDSNIGD
jgi:hypothetical protein